MSKTTSIAGVDQKLKALQELKLEQYKRQNAKIVAVLKDPNATAGDIKKAFANSWLHWISELGVEAIERRMKGRAGIEDEPMPAPTPTTSTPAQSFPESSSYPPALRSASPPVSPPAPAPSAGGGLCITFINKGAPIFYAYEPNGTITLCDHSGTPTKVGGKMFQAKLDRGENADEVAIALYRESRGEKHDHFDGPILYRDPPVY